MNELRTDRPTDHPTHMVTYRVAQDATKNIRETDRQTDSQTHTCWLICPNTVLSLPSSHRQTQKIRKLENRIPYLDKKLSCADFYISKKAVDVFKTNDWWFTRETSIFQFPYFLRSWKIVFVMIIERYRVSIKSFQSPIKMFHLSKKILSIGCPKRTFQ